MPPTLSPMISTILAEAQNREECRPRHLSVEDVIRIIEEADSSAWSYVVLSDGSLDVTRSYTSGSAETGSIPAEGIDLNGYRVSVFTVYNAGKPGVDLELIFSFAGWKTLPPRLSHSRTRGVTPGHPFVGLLQHPSEPIADGKAVHLPKWAGGYCPYCRFFVGSPQVFLLASEAEDVLRIMLESLEQLRSGAWLPDWAIGFCSCGNVRPRCLLESEFLDEKLSFDEIVPYLKESLSESFQKYLAAG